ncbi:Protein CBG19575 [Caenorhabditis briggsae]|uniref:Protein CBG19575 n=1 Tax=Caenorhabditis briggsae TaxID=6238 RepID=A8XVX7_CAEBR|nr:Protein CBG19575 [Caenorhabditis briggsae]CAP36796.2 Protein CBG19575 [Caenorhabditis briggsae]
MATTERIVVKELSSSLMDMKFMLKKKKQVEAKAAKKKEARLEAKITETEGEQATCSTEIPLISPKDEICQDYAKLENLMFGRLSFGGFNKEVEVLMNYYERLRSGEISDSEDEGKDVDDKEMAESLGGKKLSALNKKAMTKRERRQENEKNVEGVASGGGFSGRFGNKKRRNDGADVGEPQRKFLKPKEEDF